MAEGQEDSTQKRWGHLRKVLERPGPCHPDFKPSSEIMDFIVPSCKVLVVGAGGLGCELLKDLALMGFKQLHVIDMDTIDLSNLNRQFLFRKKDIGQSKAEVAAASINKRIPGIQVTPHFCKIQDYDQSFYGNFHIIVCGLDSINARRWMNEVLISLLNDKDGILDNSTIIPLVDGGTEGFKGNARVIVPGKSACVECTLDSYPSQVTYPLCTIVNTPRLPEHCIEYVTTVMWPEQNPFNSDLDGDDAEHMDWIYKKSLERASEFNITGVTYRLVQGFVKNIIPAVASTNAIIAGICATEVFKIATSCSLPLNNYMVFNGTDGIYTYTYAAQRKNDCDACSHIPQTLSIKDPNKMKLKDLITLLCDEDKTFKMKNPGITAVVDGKNKFLYFPTIKSLEERTKNNLNKSLVELGLKDGTEIIVADTTTPTPLVLKLKFVVNE